MCRWFAYISPTEPCLLEDVLVLPKHSLCQQVHDRYLPKLLPHEHDTDSENDSKARNVLYNIDGMGIAWYTSSSAAFQSDISGKGTNQVREMLLRPALYRTVQPPMNDMNFRSICANTETTVLCGHIRASSGSAITPVNNHPFVFGRHSFMHNGGVTQFTRIQRAICNEMSQSAFANVFGGTDSEHMAALYMTYLTKGEEPCSFQDVYSVEDMAEAMHKTVATIIGTQHKLFGDKKTANSLNLCATDGVKLVAYRFRNHLTSQPPSLYYSTKAGTTLNRKYPDHPDGIAISQSVSDTRIPEEIHGKHLIVASEPSTYKESDWELIGKNQCLLVDSSGKFEIHDAPYGSGWDAGDS